MKADDKGIELVSDLRLVSDKVMIHDEQRI